MKNSLIISPKKRSALEESIAKKSKILEDLMTKVELLKIELDVIKHEYNVRIGSLLLKDNQLDLELLQLKNLQDLMKKGMSYEDAKKLEEDTFYNEIIEMQKQEEKIREEQSFLDNIKDVSEEVALEIKTVWKKLIREFHPDLVLDSQEKQKREEFMKKINQAYADNDLDGLKQFESTHSIDHLHESTQEELERILENTENMIIDLEAEYKILKNSSWYEWKKKKEKAQFIGIADKTQDIFAELENKLLNDIVKKIEIVQKLREEVAPKS